MDDSVSPIKFQLRTPIDGAAENTAKFLERKLNQCIEAVTDYFCEMLVPGQGSAVKRSLLATSEAEEPNDKCPPEIMNLVEAYKNASSQQTKLVILTLLPENLSKTAAMKFFACSKYMVEKAHVLCKVNGAGCPEVSKDPIYRQRLDMGKLNFFWTATVT